MIYTVNDGDIGILFSFRETLVCFLRRVNLSYNDSRTITQLYCSNERLHVFSVRTDMTYIQDKIPNSISLYKEIRCCMSESRFHAVRDHCDFLFRNPETVSDKFCFRRCVWNYVYRPVADVVHDAGNRHESAYCLTGSFS